MSEFWNSTLIRISRQVHKCEHCYGKIDKGQSYYRETGKYEGEFCDYALCLRCKKLLNSGNENWTDEDELGEFHEKFMDSEFSKCPSCRITNISKSFYSENMLSAHFICECGKEYTVDLSAENLLKESA
jgi:hypothetical protein